jgi:hypothetical protein
MASTYVNDLRLNEMATGDQSGSWGTVTNTNLELIGEAFSYGTEAITTNADTHTTTISDGATAPGRSMFLKYTGTLDSACTITIGPNTVNKMWFIENATTGSQNIIISQGSGANITIAAGQTKAVYSDGAGAGAAFVDAFAALNVAGVSPTELAVLDGITASTAELNILDGVTATAAEINILDGVTATAAELNYNDITTLGTVQASKTVTADASGNVLFADSDELKFGAGSDLQIYHDGNNSYISDQGTGNLNILSSQIALNNPANTENMLVATADGAVTLYYNNADKIATTATGVTVTGTVAATSYTGDGSSLTGVGSTTYGAVGTYGFFFRFAYDLIEGDTYAGSGLYPAGVGQNAELDVDTDSTANLSRGGTALSGTWRAMGRWNYASGSNRTRISLFVRTV